MRNHIKSLTLLLAVCVLAMPAATAFAQSGEDPYRSVGEQVQGDLEGIGGVAESQPVADTTAAGAADGDGGALPFTGLDVALIIAVGGALLAVGLGTRRVLRQADTP